MATGAKQMTKRLSDQLADLSVRAKEIAKERIHAKRAKKNRG